MREIKFTGQQQTIWSLGRHGSIQTTGLALLEEYNSAEGPPGISIRPITSKDQVGMCSVAVAPDAVPELLVALAAMYIEKRPAEAQTLLFRLGNAVNGAVPTPPEDVEGLDDLARLPAP